ncbi:MAG: hypothetical protein ABJC10_10965 [Acidobacteriota bacterium]
MKRHVRKVFGLLAALTLFGMAWAQQGSQPRFETTLEELPFARIAEVHEIDRRCPATGKEDGNVYHYAQNAAKNNFLARGIPVPLNFSDFTRLQQASERQIAADRIVLQGKYPDDRTRLQNLIQVRGKPIGEGSVVSLIAYAFNAGYANTKYSQLSDGRPARGEAVDCDNPELDWNDIHIALSPNADPKRDQCTTVTAEISPHYRPAVWSRFHDGQKAEIEALIPGLLKQRVVENQSTDTRPLQLRLTGPLFYDASHQPCVFSGGKVAERHSPERRSIWEIHPIYRIEVYDGSKRRWLDLDSWAAKQ